MAKNTENKENTEAVSEKKLEDVSGGLKLQISKCEIVGFTEQLVDKTSRLRLMSEKINTPE